MQVKAQEVGQGECIVCMRSVTEHVTEGTNGSKMRAQNGTMVNGNKDQICGLLVT